MDGELHEMMELDGGPSERCRDARESSRERQLGDRPSGGSREKSVDPGPYAEPAERQGSGVIGLGERSASERTSHGGAIADVGSRNLVSPALGREANLCPQW